MNLVLCRWSSGSSSKASDVFFRTNTSIERVLQHFSIFVLLLSNRLCAWAYRKKQSAAGCGPYIPLPRPLLSFDQLTFPLNRSKQPPLWKEGNVYWKFRRLISARTIPVWLVSFSCFLSVCVCVRVCVCVSDRETEREEFLSDSVIRSSQSTHIGVLSGQKHTYTHAHIHKSRDLLEGRQSSAVFPS